MLYNTMLAKETLLKISEMNKFIDSTNVHK